jgi:ribosome biogenesis GTPase
MFDLAAIGFLPFFKEQLRKVDNGLEIPARIAAAHRGGYEVWAEKGAGLAQLSGRLKGELDEEVLPGVGDWVVLRSHPNDDQTPLIERVLERRTSFVRGAAGRETRAQIIAANVDVVFAVCGLDNDYSVRRIERYLARIWASGADPVVILSKSDICEDPSLREIEVQASCIGVPVHLTSAPGGRGIELIRQYIQPGTTAAFVGSSGVGKSTLINILLGEQKMTTGKTSERDGRGRHTTTHRQLIQLPEGGLLLDTPGMRELQLADDQGLDAVFADIEEIAEQCRFRDCRHDTEPGCAVKQAVASGELLAERLEHFQKLQKEAAAYELRHDEHQRRKSEKVWGQLHDEVERLRRWKSGE